MFDKKSTIRTFYSKNKSAIDNMSTDEALLASYEKGNKPIFRLYSWNKSYTIGISQKFENYKYLEDFSKDYAKRVTGGGVLFHGHDLSYSLVLPVELFEAYSIKESYEKICTFIINFYKELGLDVCYVKDSKDIQLSKNEFCQVGFEAYDILVNGQKIGGNAQRRTKNVVFQHGSIPIKKVAINDTTENKIGISLEEIGINITFDEAKELLEKSFEKSFNVILEKSNINKKELEKKEKLLKDKYDYAS